MVADVGVGVEGAAARGSGERSPGATAESFVRVQFPCDGCRRFARRAWAPRGCLARAARCCIGPEEDARAAQAFALEVSNARKKNCPLSVAFPLSTSPSLRKANRSRLMTVRSYQRQTRRSLVETRIRRGSGARFLCRGKNGKKQNKTKLEVSNNEWRRRVKAEFAGHARKKNATSLPTLLSVHFPLCPFAEKAKTGSTRKLNTPLDHSLLDPISESRATTEQSRSDGSPAQRPPWCVVRRGLSSSTSFSFDADERNR